MGSIAELIQTALQHHQAGRLAEAEAAYQDALHADPRNVDAQHFLGVIAFQRGAHERAEKLISQAIAWHHANAPALGLRFGGLAYSPDASEGLLGRFWAVLESPASELLTGFTTRPPRT